MKNVAQTEKETCFIKDAIDFERDICNAFEECVDVRFVGEDVVVSYYDRDEEDVDDDVVLGKLTDYYDVIVKHLVRVGNYSDKAVIVFYEEKYS